MTRRSTSKLHLDFFNGERHVQPGSSKQKDLGRVVVYDAKEVGSSLLLGVDASVALLSWVLML
jgi:hypothetical protein